MKNARQRGGPSRPKKKRGPPNRKVQYTFHLNFHLKLGKSAQREASAPEGKLVLVCGIIWLFLVAVASSRNFHWCSVQLIFPPLEIEVCPVNSCLSSQVKKKQRSR